MPVHYFVYNQKHFCVLLCTVNIFFVSLLVKYNDEHMNDDLFLRTIEDLEKIGSKWWPKEVRDEANKTSILKTLLDTQDEFISILKLTKIDGKFAFFFKEGEFSSFKHFAGTNVFSLIEASGLRLNLFLKHLAILTDFGAEPLKRLNTSFTELFPDGVLEAKVGEGEPVWYPFRRLPIKGTLSNQRMKIDTIENLNSGKYDKELCEDIIMILLFGAGSTNPRARAVLYKCNIYSLLGNKKAIDEFVRTNYIRVSRILAGKESNDLGNVAESYVSNYLSEKLGDDYNVQPHGHIPGVTDNEGKTLITFDIVVDRKDDNGKYKKHVGIEVSFQETTNSVVERKGGEAESRFAKVVQTRNYIAYIIDGGGNFERKNAMSDLCRFSHCNVAYTPEELDLLITFIKEKLR